MSEPNPFEGRKILSIQVIAGEGKIGQYRTDGSTLGIIEILDKSLDPEHTCYHCLDEDGKIVKLLEKCPVDITYTDNEDTYRKKIIENKMPKFDREYLEGLIEGYCDYPTKSHINRKLLLIEIEVSLLESEANVHLLRSQLKEYIPAEYRLEIIKVENESSIS